MEFLQADTIAPPLSSKQILLNVKVEEPFLTRLKEKLGLDLKRFCNIFLKIISYKGRTGFRSSYWQVLYRIVVLQLTKILSEKHLLSWLIFSTFHGISEQIYLTEFSIESALLWILPKSSSLDRKLFTSRVFLQNLGKR